MRTLGKPYLLRHTCASLLIREGRRVTEVAAQMGHPADRADRADRETLIRRARAELFEASGEAARG